jgi:hypothetical protein
MGKKEMFGILGFRLCFWFWMRWYAYVVSHGCGLRKKRNIRSTGSATFAPLFEERVFIKRFWH